MIDFLSACIGAMASLLLALASYQYQHWKSDVQTRIAIFYQARYQILRNRNLLASARKHPDKAELLLDKIQFLPTYPFTDFDILDEGFHSSAQSYDKALVLVLSDELDFDVFDSISIQSIRSIDGLVSLWSDFIKKRMLMYFLLPSLLRRIREELMQKKPQP